MKNFVERVLISTLYSGEAKVNRCDAWPFFSFLSVWQSRGGSLVSAWMAACADGNHHQVTRRPFLFPAKVGLGGKKEKNNYEERKEGTEAQG